MSCQNSSTSLLLHCNISVRLSVCLSVCVHACIFVCVPFMYIYPCCVCVHACFCLSWVMCYAGGILSSWLSGGALVVSHPDPSLIFCRCFWSEGACQKWWWNRGDASGCEISALVRMCNLHCIVSEYAISMSLTCPYFSLQRGSSSLPHKCQLRSKG